MTTVLTITTLITNTNEGLPKISHLTALDIYLFFSFSLVFLSLIEYAVVGYYDMAVEDRKLKGENSQEKRKEEILGKNEDILSEEPVIQARKPSFGHIEDTSIIDAYARYFFPLFFALFNVVYTLVLMLIRVYSEGDELNEVQVRFI